MSHIIYNIKFLLINNFYYDVGKFIVNFFNEKNKKLKQFSATVPYILYVKISIKEKFVAISHQVNC